MRASIIKVNKTILWKITGVLLLLAIWEIIAAFSHPLIVPNIQRTGSALYTMAVSGEIAGTLWLTIQKMLTGLAIGVVLGVVLGSLGGLSRTFNGMFMPSINTILATPSVIFVIIAMVWFGVGSTLVIFIVGLLVFPIMYMNTVKAIHTIDGSLLQMAQVYRIPWKYKMRKLYLPGILNGFIAGFTLSAASAIRLAVFAEVFAGQNGVGPAITQARNYLETDKLFAWAIILILLVVVIELFILRPIEKFINKRTNA
ncbi:hypothetical protein JT05_03160 [Desulfosporosinus sp. Tol-M]|jgi:ABC-type nitrate/sulfonate/bicarbonate transport system, permease component|nr:hypothetical protein JT05_03160 [Desulfosporosinus sp. Tol-M]